MITGPDGKPTSARNLIKVIERHAQQLPAGVDDLYRRTVRNAIFMQFLSGDDYLKGGTSVQIRYPFAEGRLSRDIDAAYSDSIEAFTQRLRTNLEQGWEGFSGTVGQQKPREQPFMPTGHSMTSLDVRLSYKGKPFARIELEAVPDINGVAQASEQRMDEGTRSLLAQIGFDIRTPRVMNLYAQLADKLHALSRPGVYRGRDLADIALIAAHETIDCDDLRAATRHVEHVQQQHMVHMLDEREKPRYSEAFYKTYAKTTAYHDFDECWAIAQRLLEQVDESKQAN